MKAARFYDKNDIRVETIPDPPPPANDEVTIAIHWSGICGSDLHEYTCGPMVINPPDRPHGATGDHLPLTMGHEFCGRIAATPDGADDTLKVGQAVMVDPRINCDNHQGSTQCLACQEGSDNICANWGFLGLNGGGGGGAGFSELVNVKTRNIHVLPDTVDLNDAALIEPLAVARHALTMAGTNDFSKLDVLVLGGGPVGVALLFNLKASGVGRVFVSEPTARRSATIKDLELAGNEDIFNPLLTNVPDECRKKTNGKGVDIVFDCAGIPAALTTGMDSLRVRGTYVNVAGWEQPLVLPLYLCMLKEIAVKFSMAYDNEDFKNVVADFAAGKFKGAEKMITARISLDDLTVKGFDELMTKKDEHVKIVVTPRVDLLGR